MAGPMATLVPGRTRVAASASTWAAGVAQDLQALVGVEGDDAHAVAVVDRRGQVDQSISDLGGDGRLGQAGTDSLSHSQGGGSVRHRQL